MIGYSLAYFDFTPPTRGFGEQQSNPAFSCCTWSKTSSTTPIFGDLTRQGSMFQLLDTPKFNTTSAGMSLLTKLNILILFNRLQTIVPFLSVYHLSTHLI